MKTTLYFLLLAFFTINFSSCTPDEISDRSDHIERATDVGGNEEDPDDSGE
ncbi:hypothetical protein JM84_0815 [Dokdonia sp. Hel_I_63]|uniref:hypothetical protein n=1 Tax=unclassified Dokdonia TaxID=2615033 RepID=UPI00020A60BB|nr:MULTISPECIES: hypothetical protein [unclassified Dokdonia]AEE18837.1 hypothetical protein Krodi_0853 [Dokdonia sp. 4H-3-7-5]TVZ21935.1 hypothetical protein JM84_0815 [Dokdonia sp. Hel_I_63]